MKKTGSKKSPGEGFRRTPQRLAILGYLDGNRDHPSAEDIYREISKKHHSMSFATVYNTLNALTRAGALRELTIDPDRKRYDPDTSLHNHLICVSCRKIMDAGQVATSLPRGAGRDFTVMGSHVEFYGYCGGCRKKKRRGSGFSRKSD